MTQVLSSHRPSALTNRRPHSELFAAADRAATARDRHDARESDRWERQVSLARIELCRRLGDDRLVETWTAWHHDRWPDDNQAGEP
ncbi:MAG: hypothetical protein M3063_15175 [Actinomycetota bacterium]|nr:hypothetical protein [Actinomycetota bacterium]